MGLKDAVALSRSFSGIALAGAFIALAGSVALAIYSQKSRETSAEFVTVDAVEITNAERAVASSLFNHNTNGGNQDAILSLNNFGKKVTEKIKQVANGRTVLVKQAVVLGSLPDITDEVLDRLNLPKGSPTIDIGKQLEMAPTTSYQLMGVQLNGAAKDAGKEAVKSYVETQKQAAENALP